MMDQVAKVRLTTTLNLLKDAGTLDSDLERLENLLVASKLITDRDTPFNILYLLNVHGPTVWLNALRPCRYPWVSPVFSLAVDMSLSAKKVADRAWIDAYSETKSAEKAASISDEVWKVAIAKEDKELADVIRQHLLTDEEAAS